MGSSQVLLRRRRRLLLLLYLVVAGTGMGGVGATCTPSTVCEVANTCADCA